MSGSPFAGLGKVDTSTRARWLAPLSIVLGSLVTLLFRGAYCVLVTTSFYYRLTGIRLGR